MTTTKRTIAVAGDSQTDTQYGNGVQAWDVWGPTLSTFLNSEGLAYQYQTRVFGVGGETTTQLLARLGQMMRYDKPDMAGIAIGINDPGNSITDAQSTLNMRCMMLALKHGAMGDQLAAVSPTTGQYMHPVSVAGQANLPTLATPGTRMVVQSDTSTTGGQPAIFPSQAATITGSVASSGPAVWEMRNQRAGEDGWGRVAVSTTPPTYCSKVFAVSPPYRNWTSGGDTPSTPNATVLEVRNNISAAVTAENVNVGGVPTVVYVDLYNYLRNRIVGGTTDDPDFSSVSYDATKTWHIAATDQHLNAYGHKLKAAAVRAAIPAAWLA